MNFAPMLNNAPSSSYTEGHHNLTAAEWRARRNIPQYWSQIRIAQSFCQLCGGFLLVYTCLSGTSLVRDRSWVERQTFVDPATTLALLYSVPILCAGTVSAYIVTQKAPLQGAATTEPNFYRFASLYFGIPAALYVLGSVHRHWGDHNDDRPMLVHVSNTLGVVAVFALSILMVPVARHNVLCRLFGWNTAAAVRLHIGAGIIVMIAVFGHVGIYVVRWIAKGELLSRLLLPPAECIWRKDYPYDPIQSTSMSCLVLEGTVECSCYPLWRNFWGAAAMFAMVVIGLSGLIRRRYYSLFYRVHILAGPTMLLGAVLHWHRSSLYLAGGAIYYMACGFCSESSKCQIRAVEIIGGGSRKPCVSVTVAANERVAPGQYVKLHAPELSSVAHPFTANTTTSGDLQIIFRCKGLFTTRLMERLMCEARLPAIYLDGMYGSSQRLLQVASHDVSLIVAGGIGITPYLSLLTDATAACHRVVLHWVCRDTALINYVVDHYFSKTRENVQVVIHHTGLIQKSVNAVCKGPSPSDLAFDDIEMQRRDIKSIQISDAPENQRFRSTRIPLFPFVTSLWLGFGGIAIFSRNYVTADEVLPRLLGPAWVVVLCWMLQRMTSLDSDYAKGTIGSTKQRQLCPPTEASPLIRHPICNCRHTSTSFPQLNVVLSSGRPSVTNLLESIQGAEKPGVFACGPSDMLEGLRKELKRKNRRRQRSCQITLFEEVFDL